MQVTSPRAVVFDWDGTLLLTRNTVVRTLEKVLAEYGLPSWEITKKKRDEKKSLADNFEIFFGANHIKAYENYLSLYLDDIEKYDVSKPAQVDSLLSLLSCNNVPFVIASNKERVLLSAELKKAFPSVNFQSIVCGGETLYNKPHKEHALAALKNIIQPEDIDNSVWLIGDSQQDIDCAVNVGCTPVLIGDGLFCNGNYLPSVSKYQSISELYLSLLKTLARNSL